MKSTQWHFRAVGFLVAAPVWLLSGCSFISGHGAGVQSDCVTMDGQSVCYQIVDGRAMVEQDILVKRSGPGRGGSRGAAAFVGDSGENLWPGGVVPYVISSELEDPVRVLDSFSTVEDNTNVRFVARTNEPDYVVVQPASSENDCSSYVGRIGGPQELNLGSHCTTGNVMHEVGHLLGLLHEHSRRDRDRYLVVHWNQIRDGFGGAFRIHASRSGYEDLVGYDYDSIMHYGPLAFARGDLPTVTRPDGSTQGLGQRMSYSAGDLAALRVLYPDAPAQVLQPDLTSTTGSTSFRFASMVSAPNGQMSCGLGTGGSYCWSPALGPTSQPIAIFRGASAVAVNDYGLVCEATGASASCGNTSANQVSVIKTAGQIQQVALGTNWACAIAQNGGTSMIYCPAIFTPRPLAAPGKLVAAGPFACFVDNGTPYCFSETERVPQPVGMLSGGVTDLATNGRTTCAVRYGSAYCWGDNSAGLLASRSVASSATPLPIPIPGRVASVSVGQLQACAVDTKGNAYCWGQYGNLSAPDQPQALRDLGAVSSISVGAYHACVVASGNVTCWRGPSGTSASLFGFSFPSL